MGYFSSFGASANTSSDTLFLEGRRRELRERLPVPFHATNERIEGAYATIEVPGGVSAHAWNHMQTAGRVIGGFAASHIEPTERRVHGSGR